jgi:hypothetical protein
VFSVCVSGRLAVFLQFDYNIKMNLCYDVLLRRDLSHGWLIVNIAVFSVALPTSPSRSLFAKHCTVSVLPAVISGPQVGQLSDTSPR